MPRIVLRDTNRLMDRETLIQNLSSKNGWRICSNLAST